MLTQPIPIGVSDEDDMSNRNRNTNIEQIVENAGNRVTVELTDQLWDLLKSNFFFIGKYFDNLHEKFLQKNEYNFYTKISQLVRHMKH